MYNIGLSFLAATLIHAVLSEGPKVTLSHGGQLRGRTFTYNGTNVDLFLGVRYAKAPVGALRFSRPEDAESWSGERDAISTGSVCSQLNYQTGGFYGSEDCLFLDITVPGGVQTQNLKPVMVWIHGGGYFMGTGSQYPAAPLAVHGDVIVVTMNYRLGIYGFLSSGKGTGNFGLWDQRKALQWIQTSIRAFGGDPNQITLFGETTGSSSVAAQVLSQQTNSLFARAIQMSNGLYTNFGWYMTRAKSYSIDQLIRTETNCDICVESIYDCFKGKTQTQIETIRQKIDASIPTPLWVPIADDDFFAESITNEDYTIPNTVDLLAGFNGQEGGQTLYFFLRGRGNTALANGITATTAAQSVNGYCGQTTDPNTCYQYLQSQYGISVASSDRDRAIKLSQMWGEVEFNSDVLQELTSHSKTNQKTFAYYFTEKYQPPAANRAWALPDWAKVSADNADQVPFVWGYVYTKENPSVLQEYIGSLPAITQVAATALVNGPSESDKPLTDLIMTAWTNFAKSGNPNEPVALPIGVPAWPEFTESSNDFMRLDSQNYTTISTPNKARLEGVIENYRNERITWASRQNEPEIAPVDCDKKQTGDSSASDRSPQTKLVAAVMLLVLFYY